MKQPSTRARVVTRRTYNRPLNEEGTKFETWEQTVDRVIEHQRWLWERAQGRDLSHNQTNELAALRELMLARKVSVSGRTLWLGGTHIAQTREASQFNCSFGRIETVTDVVDAFWLLLQGCGVGFEPVTGILNGFNQPVQVEIVRSAKNVASGKGIEHSQEAFYTDANSNKVWRLTVGDSAEAWAKAAGKLLAMKRSVDRVVIDFSQVRAAGIRLKGYGWISSGDETISVAFEKISAILSKRSGELLTEMDILDLLNHLGTALSSRRSAEIALMDADSKLANEFIFAKKDFWLHDNHHRQQSNNSLLFKRKPSIDELSNIFEMMEQAGGSEPGFINNTTALVRAPWFKGVNPCAEILLGNKSFCNLVEVDWGKFTAITDWPVLQWAIRLAARANYRQTCVNLRDEILQNNWHELNEYLRLCGVGATGIVKLLDHLEENGDDLVYCLQRLRKSAVDGAYSMADELGLPRPKAVTTVKPSGTLSKIMDTTEGVHRPLGKYIINNVKFSKHDPLVAILKAANYRVTEIPFETDSVVIAFPVSYEDVKFDVVDGKEVNLESAVKQLDRYKLMMDNYVDHNCSVTISYDKDEVPEIVEWISKNWDSYVGVSFIYRNDPTKTAADLGYLYLPQEVVTKETYTAYAETLLPFDLDAANAFDELQDEGCATGACPIR